MLGNLDVKICRTTTSQLSAQDLDETYIIQRPVGQGKYGQVFRAQNKLNKQIVALKKIKQEKEANGFPRTAMREIHLLSSIKHQNIVSFQEVVVQSKNTYLVLEYMDTDLHNLLQRRIVFSLDQVRYLMYQILEALSYLHSRNVYHRDLKPNNILYNVKGQVKICDFGMANEYSKKRPQTKRILVPQYRAPEIYLGGQYDCSVDVWSAGILFLELIVKPSPFVLAKSESQCFSKIIDLCGTPTEDVSSLPLYHELINEPKERTLRKYLHAQQNAMPQLIDLIDKMLTLNPAKRITAKEALKHQYFQTRIFVMMPVIEQDAQPPKDPPIQKKVKQEQQKPLLQGIKINKCM
ncbi:unnamed protein product (macronuclear) [Paramecium tetraurelia]|uniref:Cyclin-dependent kinase 2 homolog n=1 Tax=Paramecium tetraurelia TaxID=5888 RepID=A0DWP8_PARTE|nr:uncharacterized protein GSPATT00021108001 [Paramecium tetraurelia]CAK87465.1 unnamed protein product [Paramecium tetraurelia]|eukprot:XP_001454862.1 hypothetical protein (macronuclear) [Paramecium tetraurelia strain d4-2]